MARLLTFLLAAIVSHAGVTLSVPARLRSTTAGSAGVRIISQQWDPAKTALILCDFWDSHHCANAVKRVSELAPCIAAVVGQAREMSLLIVHAPSDCMEAYAAHPARQRAIEGPFAPNLPKGIDAWMNWISTEEEKCGYPIDAFDGGCDDNPKEAAAWKTELKKQGRHTGHPWLGQHSAVKIDAERDIISDKGTEIWNVLHARGINDVLLAGVHANMCVCGRPFGLMQLAKNGKNVVLLRDLTDTMYNPAMRPQVGHTAGTELIVSHIERFIAPTVLSTEVFGGETPLFTHERRRHLAIMIGEDEYRTEETLPAFMDSMVKDFRVTYILPTKEKPADFFNMTALATADLLLVSVRHRLLPRAQLAALRKFAERGGANAGIRTASHAFAQRDGQQIPPVPGCG